MADARTEIQAAITARDQASGVMRRVGRNADRLKSRFTGLFGSIRSGGQRAIAFLGGFRGALLGILSIAAFRKLTGDVDELAKTSKRLGVTTEFLSEMQVAAELSGTSFEEMANGLRFFSRAVTEAKRGTAEYLDTFNELGINVQEFNGRQDELEQLLSRVADRFQASTDATQRAAQAQELFGRSGIRMVPLLRDGSEGLREMRREARRFGATIGAEEAAQIEEFNDNITKLATSFKSLARDALLPAIKAINQFLEDIGVAPKRATRSTLDVVRQQIAELEEALRSATAPDAIKKINDRLAVLRERVPILEEMSRSFKDAGDAAEEAGEKVGGAAQTITTSAPRISGLLESMAAGAADFRDQLGLIDEDAEVFDVLAKQARQASRNLLTDIRFDMSDLLFGFLEREVRGIQDLFEGMLDSLRRSFFRFTADIVSSQFSSVLTDVFGLVLPSLGGGGGGGGASSAVQFQQGNVGGVGSATGNVFFGGAVTPFQRGGIIGAPIAFPMRRGVGLAGEAGPEAILPLRRGPRGRLGVESNGGGPAQVNVTIVAADARSLAQVAARDPEPFANLIVRVVSRNPQVAAALRGAL